MEQSFPFNSVNHDRRYKAEDFATYFKPFLANGVFAAPSTNLQVTAGGTDMKIAVQPGDAWINGYGYHNDAPKYIQLTNADGAANRIDRLVLRWSRANRQVTAEVKQGEYATTPVAPDVQRDADIYELALADVLVSAGVTSISQANITDQRPNSDICGWVNSLIHVESSTLYEQFRQQFNDWFAHIQSSLNANQVGNLQNQIDNKAVQTYVHSKNGTVHNLAGLGPEGKFLAVADYDIDDTFSVNDVSTPAMLADGSYLPDKLFRAGNWTHFTFDGAKINFNSAGGAVSLNLFCQPDEPKMKDGLWIKSPEKNDVRRIISRESYDIGGDWRRKVDWPAVPSGVSLNQHPLRIGNKLYFLQRKDTSCQITFYSTFDISTHTWGQTQTDEAFSTSVYRKYAMFDYFSGGKINVVIVDYSTSGSFLTIMNDDWYIKSIETYDPATDTWTSTAKTGTFKTLGAIIGRDGDNIYFQLDYYPGGSNTNAYYFRSYNTATNTYQAICTQDDGQERNGSWLFVSSVYLNGKIYMFRSILYSNNSYSNTLRVYDIDTGKYSDAARWDKFQTTVNNSTIDKHPVAALGKIYSPITGGNGVQVYDPRTDTWSTLPDVPKLWNYLFPLEDKFVAVGSDISIYDLQSEVLPKNTLALISGRENLITLISTRGIDSLNSSFSDVWWYDTNFREYPTYIGDGKQWNKIKN